jgi:hypothetical protein
MDPPGLCESLQMSEAPSHHPQHGEPTSFHKFFGTPKSQTKTRILTQVLLPDLRFIFRRRTGVPCSAHQTLEVVGPVATANPDPRIFRHSQIPNPKKTRNPHPYLRHTLSSWRHMRVASPAQPDPGRLALDQPPMLQG